MVFLEFYHYFSLLITCVRWLKIGPWFGLELLVDNLSLFSRGSWWLDGGWWWVVLAIISA